MATVELAYGTHLTQDFAVHIRLTEPYAPRMWVEIDEHGHRAAMLAFYPQFSMDDSSQVDITFVVDRSASMKGDALTEARRALHYGVLSLPHSESITYNVVSFGSTVEWLFPAAVCANDEAARKKVAEFCRTFQNNLGGTDLPLALRPLMLQAVHTHARSAANNAVVLLTDAQLTHPNAARDLLRRHLAHARLFVFACGDNISRNTARSLARTAGGEDELLGAEVDVSSK